MAFAYRIARLAFFKGVSNRVRALPKGPDSKRRILGIACFLLALFLAAWARQIAEVTALSSWLNSHHPSEMLWQQILALDGFNPVKEEHLLHQALRTLPLNLDEPGSVWMTADNGWIAVFQDTSPSETVFTMSPSQPPLQWEPLGTGWIGFEAALRRAQWAAAAGKKVAPPKPQAVREDPRAIRY